MASGSCLIQYLIVHGGTLNSMWTPMEQGSGGRCMVILDVIPDYAWSGFKPMKQDSGCPGKVILNVITDYSWLSFKLRVSTYG